MTNSVHLQPHLQPLKNISRVYIVSQMQYLQLQHITYGLND